jgi:hypothetical protein
LICSDESFDSLPKEFLPKTHSDRKPLESANDDAGLGKQDERVQVAK